MSPKISKYRKKFVFSPNLLIFSLNFVVLARNIFFIAIFIFRPTCVTVHFLWGQIQLFIYNKNPFILVHSEGLNLNIFFNQGEGSFHGNQLKSLYSGAFWKAEFHNFLPPR